MIPLLFDPKTRAEARALSIAVALFVTIGVALGGAYLMGGLVKAAGQHARFARLAGAADGYSEVALHRAAADDSILAVARRLDPGTALAPEVADSNRQLAQMNRRLQSRLDVSSRGLLLRASLRGLYNPAVSRFYFPGALERSRELDCLTQAVYYEARGETPNGQAAVAQVVLNRARNPNFPKSICGVVFQRAVRQICQFSFACDGSTLQPREARAWRRAQTIASRSLDGFVMAEVGSATHFHSLNVAPIWGPHLLRVTQVGMHIFYRFSRRGAVPGDFTSEVEFVNRDMADAAGSLPILQAASAILDAQSTLVEGGVGGPATKAVEPASAPAAKLTQSRPGEQAEAKSTGFSAA